MDANEEKPSVQSERERTAGWSVMGSIALVVVALTVGWFVFASVYGIGVGAGARPYSPGTPLSGNAPVRVYLTIVNTPAGLDQFLPANVTVPVNTPIQFQITNYDSGVNNVSAAAGTVKGTDSGTENVQGGITGTPSGPVRSLPAGDVSHTFSILFGHSLNVVVPPAANYQHPDVVTFTVTFTSAGTYNWLCLAPCDPSSMSFPGFMSGTITVS